jgi:hypothetical protein
MSEVDQNFERDLEYFEFGLKMRPIVISPSWPDLVQFVNDYVNKIDKVYRRLEPGDPSVVGSHAAVHALDEFADKFKNDLEAAVQYSEHPSPELMAELRQVRDASDVALSMGPRGE